MIVEDGKVISSGSNRTNATRNVRLLISFLLEPGDVCFTVFLCSFACVILPCDCSYCQATRHAEMEAIDVLLREWQKMGLDQAQVADKFAGCDLYVTCEPCIMCATALSILGMNSEVFESYILQCKLLCSITICDFNCFTFFG